MQQEFKAAFGLFTEGKEKLDADQLNRTLKKFGMPLAFPCAALFLMSVGVKGDARAMIKEADTANEGSIDFIAFSAMMAKKMASVRSPCKHRNFGRRPTRNLFSPSSHLCPSLLSASFLPPRISTRFPVFPEGGVFLRIALPVSVPPLIVPRSSFFRARFHRAHDN